MFSATLIVFRETLEAALLIGIVAAATRGLPQRNRWLGAGITAGLLASCLLASVTDRIAALSDGSGQEIFNATILGLAVLMLGWHIVWMRRHGQELAQQARSLAADLHSGQRELSALTAVVALTVLREGSETVLFLYGAAAGEQSSAAATLLGGALGLVGGVLLGAVLYAGLLRIPLKWLFATTNTLVLLLAAGMAGQMARNLIQSDLLPSLATPLWDSSRWLPMDSGLGAVLRVIAGYDANPSGMQALFYFGTLVAIAVGMALTRPRFTTAS